MDQGLAAQVEATFHIPDADFDERNILLGRLVPYVAKGPYDVKHKPNGHGPYPGTGCKGVSAVLLQCADNPILENLAGKLLAGAYAVCESVPSSGPVWPLQADAGYIWGYQNSVRWDELADVQWYVGIAFGELVFDAEGPDFPDLYQDVAGDDILAREDFAKIFSLLVFNRDDDLSVLALRDRSVTFDYRKQTVKGILENWS